VLAGKTKRAGRPRWLEYVLYFSAATLIVGALVVYAFTASNPSFPVVPISTIGMTLIVFGNVVLFYRTAWKSVRFWILFFGLLATHSIAVAAWILYEKGPSLFLAAILAGPEFLLVSYALERFATQRQK